MTFDLSGNNSYVVLLASCHESRRNCLKMPCYSCPKSSEIFRPKNVNKLRKFSALISFSKQKFRKFIFKLFWLNISPIMSLNKVRKIDNYSIMKWAGGFRSILCHYWHELLRWNAERNSRWKLVASKSSDSAWKPLSL